MAPTSTNIEINGFAVRELRKRNGDSVQELADALGVQRAYVTKIELGHSRRVSPRVFNRLLTALAVTDRRALLNNPYALADADEAGAVA